MFWCIAMSEKSELLRPEDVVTVSNPSVHITIPHPTFRVSELAASLLFRLVSDSGPHKEWATGGVKAEVLTGSQDWRKGKVRLTVEFIPDDPAESEEEPTV